MNKFITAEIRLSQQESEALARSGFDAHRWLNRAFPGTVPTGMSATELLRALNDALVAQLAKTRERA